MARQFAHEVVDESRLQRFALVVFDFARALVYRVDHEFAFVGGKSGRVAEVGRAIGSRLPTNLILFELFFQLVIFAERLFGESDSGDELTQRSENETFAVFGLFQVVFRARHQPSFFSASARRHGRHLLRVETVCIIDARILLGLHQNDDCDDPEKQ